MEMMIKAFIFDFDETLSNRQIATYEKLHKYFDEHLNIDEDELEAFIQDAMLADELGYTTKEERTERMFTRYPQYKYLQDDYVNWWIDCPVEKTYLFEETMDVLIKLKEKNYKIGIITNGESILQHRKIELVGIDKYLDAVIVSEDVNIRKPNPEIFEMMAQKLNLKCEECCMVGDTFSTDILGAIKSGMDYVTIFRDKYRPIKTKYKRIYNLNELLDLYE